MLPGGGAHPGPDRDARCARQHAAVPEHVCGAAARPQPAPRQARRDGRDDDRPRGARAPQLCDQARLRREPRHDQDAARPGARPARRAARARGPGPRPRHREEAAPRESHVVRLLLPRDAHRRRRPQEPQGVHGPRHGQGRRLLHHVRAARPQRRAPHAVGQLRPHAEPPGQGRDRHRMYVFRTLTQPRTRRRSSSSTWCSRTSTW